MRFRIYPDGEVLDECNYPEEDCANAESDDFREVEVPDEVVVYIAERMPA
jgi:hypothetical protein